MRTIAHLSDLHFGRTDPLLVSRLKEQLDQLRPDLVIVSGDLTQRAKTTEFQEARAFLDAMPAPLIVVPGNHDISLYNPYSRFVNQLQKYQCHISADTEPTYSGPGLLVVSANTARSFAFKGGRINPGQVNRIRDLLLNAPPGVVKILVAHHPLDLDESLPQALAGRARMALASWAGAGLDMILSGHLHLSRFSTAAERLRIGGHSALLIQAGTAVSTRSRGEINSFNWIEAAHSRIAVYQHCWTAQTETFTPCCTEVFERSGANWVRI